MFQLLLLIQCSIRRNTHLFKPASTPISFVAFPVPSFPYPAIRTTFIHKVQYITGTPKPMQKTSPKSLLQFLLGGKEDKIWIYERSF